MDRERFIREILPTRQPAILKGAVAQWPAVALAKQSDDDVASYLKICDSGHPAQTLLGKPAIEGRFFYGDRIGTFNFTPGKVTIALAVDRILKQRGLAKPHAVYVQSAPVADHLPRFAEENRLDFVDAAPRIWIGNQVHVQTHYDLYDNLACVVAGRRRFRLFPPEEVANLYPGPLRRTLAGTPVSMASLDDPDLDLHPRTVHAIASAQVAELEAGDVLYIPYGWWHQVSSHAGLNVLINYWWNDTPPTFGSPYLCLMHAALALRTLPLHQRATWKAMFDYYIFENQGDPVKHLQRPEDREFFELSDPIATAAWQRDLLAQLDAAGRPSAHLSPENESGDDIGA